MTYLLDTNIVVFMVRGLKVRENPNALQRERLCVAHRILERARQQSAAGHEVALSAITVAELEFGLWRSGDYEAESDAIRRAISPFAKLSFDADECAARYGAVRHTLESSGKGIGSLDTLIAAHALALGATLVTNDTTDYSRVPGMRCEDWCRSGA
jgi:tRNA(fMet)-specific endonuclease VapC